MEETKPDTIEHKLKGHVLLTRMPVQDEGCIQDSNNVRRTLHVFTKMATAAPTPVLFQKKDPNSLALTSHHGLL